MPQHAVGVAHGYVHVSSNGAGLRGLTVFVRNLDLCMY